MRDIYHKIGCDWNVCSTNWRKRSQQNTQIKRILAHNATKDAANNETNITILESYNAFWHLCRIGIYIYSTICSAKLANTLWRFAHTFATFALCPNCKIFTPYSYRSERDEWGYSLHSSNEIRNNHKVHELPSLLCDLIATSAQMCFVLLRF